jgi:hypothetical protein
MRQRGSILGLTLKLAYQLHRHRLLGISMDWMVVGLVVVAAVILWRASELVWAVVLGGLATAGLLAIWLAGRVDYLIFRPGSEADPNPAQERLEPDREIRVHATGPFAVHGQVRYLVEERAIYTTPRSREHIVMAKLAATRLLLVGKSDSEAWGWWYQFFKPEMIESIETGQAVHGWHIRPALRVIYQAEDEREHRQSVSLVLSFEDRERRALVWADITYEQRASGASPWRSAAFRRSGYDPTENRAEFRD